MCIKFKIFCPTCGTYVPSIVKDSQLCPDVKELLRPLCLKIKVFPWYSKCDDCFLFEGQEVPLANTEEEVAEMCNQHCLFETQISIAESMDALGVPPYRPDMELGLTTDSAGLDDLNSQTDTSLREFYPGEVSKVLGHGSEPSPGSEIARNATLSMYTNYLSRLRMDECGLTTDPANDSLIKSMGMPPPYEQVPNAFSEQPFEEAAKLDPSISQ